MARVVQLSWFVLALVHLFPAAVIVSPGLLKQLYGVDPSGDVGILLIHRGMLFGAIVAVCLYALFDRQSRRAAGIVLAISIVGFLGVYMLSGAPAGPLRMIAIVDVLALAPLGFVLLDSWR